jgi:hypothetical protein
VPKEIFTVDEYEQRLAAAQTDPLTADFHALRMAYIRSARYEPYATHGQEVRALRDALHAHDYPAAVTAAEAILARDYLDIEAHMAADFAHTQLENRAASTYHRTFAQRLLSAIAATGTGQDLDHALVVIRTSEEYVVLRVMGLVSGGQRLVEHNGHWYDVLSAMRPGSRDIIEVFFNIDLPFTWLNNQHQRGGTHEDESG